MKMEDLPFPALSSIYSYLDVKTKLNLRVCSSKLWNTSKTVSCWENINSVHIMDVDCHSHNLHGICTNPQHESVQLIIEMKKSSDQWFFVRREMLSCFVASTLQYARNITSLTIRSKEPAVIKLFIHQQHQKLTHLAVTSRLTAREIPSILKLIRG